MRFIKRGIGAALCLALTVAAMPAAFAKDFTVQLPVTESTAIPSLKDDFYLHTDGAWIKSAKIPKDDMLGFLIPFSGVGNATAIIALTIYALLPMRRDGKMGKDIYLTEDTAGKYPLTQAQRGVYFEAVRHPERMNYNLALDMRFSRQVDTGKLQQAVQNIVDAFPVFRTRICEDHGGTACLR